MASKVTWSPEAIEDIEQIAVYIAKDSPAYAGSVVRKILASGRHLGSFPISGRVVPEVGTDAIREVFAFNYRIIYRVEPSCVTILTVVHQKRSLTLLP
jgi:toxin ParE1/3/4